VQSGSTRILKLGLLGQHLEHSISPELHERLFRILAERATEPFAGIKYTLSEVATPADLFAWIAHARTEGYRGANVTYPYKELIATAIQHPSKLARRIESANALMFSTNVSSISTDGRGFMSALRRRIPEDLAGRELIVLGAGGAARALAAECLSIGFRSITVCARNVTRAASGFRWAPSITVLPIAELRRRTAPALVIQATTVGQGSSENIAANFEWHQDDIAADVVYRPVETAFLASARAAGARTIDGLGMLIEQAALSQHWWLTGVVPKESPLSSSEFDALWNLFSPQLR
jgi:shikimate dehydrogenase